MIKLWKNPFGRPAPDYDFSTENPAFRKKLKLQFLREASKAALSEEEMKISVTELSAEDLDSLNAAGSGQRKRGTNYGTGNH